MLLGLTVGSLAAASYSIASDVDKETRDDADAGLTTFFPVPRPTPASSTTWLATDTDPYLEVQEYALGSIGKFLQKMRRPKVNAAERVYDYRLLLKSPGSAVGMELAESTSKKALQKLQSAICRIATLTELGAPVDPKLSRGIPTATWQAVVGEAQRRASSRAESSSLAARTVLRRDVQRHIYSFLTAKDAAADARCSNQLSQKGVMCAASNLTKCAMVCRSFAEVASTDHLWRPLLFGLNRSLDLVQDSSLAQILESEELRDALSAKQLFLLTSFEHRTPSESRSNHVARGLYGLQEELQEGALTGGLLAAGCAANGAVLGYAPGACVGATVAAVPGAIVGGCRHQSTGGDFSSGAVWGGATCGLCGSACGGLVTGAVGGVLGCAVGTAVGLPGMIEGAGKGLATCSGHTAAGLRELPDQVFGPLQAATQQHPNASRVHEHARGVTWGALLGLRRLGGDAVDACANLVREPVQGARQQHAAGAFRGLGRALLGLVARPAAGALDVVGGVARGVGNRIEHTRHGRLVDEVSNDISAARASCRASFPSCYGSPNHEYIQL